MSMIARTGLHGRARRAAFTFMVLSAAAWCLAAPDTAVAQQPSSKSSASSAAHAVDVRWYPWVGCWQRTTDAGPGGVLTCVVPAEGASAVDVVTVANGTVESREHLVADGRPHAIDKDGCTGSKTAMWATTGSRVYVGSAYTCAGNIHGRSSTLYAILPTGEWIDAREVDAGGGRNLTITRYRDAGLPSSVPASIRSQLARHSLTATTARASAGASVSENEVAEAQRAVDTAVVQAWLTARNQGYGYGGYGNAPAAPPVTQVHVYQGTPPAREQPMVDAYPSGRIPTCDASGCYVENPYSEYNGLTYVPYPAYPTMWNGYYGNPYGFGYYPYPYSVVVYGTGGRYGYGGRGPIYGGRGPIHGGGGIIHGLPGGRPPQGPSGYHPGQAPRPTGGGRVPGRGRP